MARWEQEMQAGQEADLAGLQRQREIWRPELEELARLRASKDLEWQVYGMGLEHLQQLDLEVARQAGATALEKQRQAGRVAEFGMERAAKQEDIAQFQAQWGPIVQKNFPDIPAGAVRNPTDMATLLDLKRLQDVEAKSSTDATAKTDAKNALQELIKGTIADNPDYTPTEQRQIKNAQNADDFRQAWVVISQERGRVKAAQLSEEREARLGEPRPLTQREAQAQALAEYNALLTTYKLPGAGQLGKQDLNAIRDGLKGYVDRRTKELMAVPMGGGTKAQAQAVVSPLPAPPIGPPAPAEFFGVSIPRMEAVGGLSPAPQPVGAVSMQPRRKATTEAEKKAVEWARQGDADYQRLAEALGLEW